MLLLANGEAGEAWESSNESLTFWLSGSNGYKITIAMPVPKR